MVKAPHISLLARLCAVVVAIAAAFAPARALDLDTYAQQSRLASGKWVKISVPEAGLYRIPAATLRSWGFNNPANVRICGYGGARIADRLDAENYVDDLPAVPSVNSAEGVTFYATGAATLMQTSGYRHWQMSPYSSVGYYFVTEDADLELPAPASTGTPGSHGAATTGYALAQHEQDLTSATIVGPLMVGENLRGVQRLPITLATPGRVAGTMYYEAQMVTRMSAAGSATLTVADLAPKTLAIGATSGTYTYGTLTVFRDSGNSASGGETLSASLAPSLPANVQNANFDYLAVYYPISLSLGSGALDFFSSSREVHGVSGANSSTVIWDVTDPAAPCAVNASAGSGVAAWTPTAAGERHYVAWNADSKLPAPSFVGRVANQNLHGDTSTPEMVIFTTPAVARIGRKIAELHEAIDTMKVAVVALDDVYNEFSSGTPDISGARKYLKMLYDRGNAAGRPLRYALLLGRPTLDHRGLLSDGTSGYVKAPCWVVRNDRQSMTETDAFGTDDFLAMLEDGEGENLGIDNLSIAVGRMPMISADEGDVLVEKLTRYARQSKKTGWKNKFMFVADDEDSGVHLRQAETVVDNMRQTPRQQHMFNKVYLDAYNLVNGEYPQARADMFHALDEGVAWMYFIGHATNHSWTGENQLNFTDINNMYLRNVPFIMASTCNFLQWDKDEMSGGEILYKESQGGCIGMISATRPAYITDNGYLLAAFGRNNLERDESGCLLTPGEVYRRAKNDIRDSRGVHVSNTNRLRFAFMGDPAMPLCTPSNIIEITAIDGVAPDADSQVTIAAMANVTIQGRVTDPDGALLSDFDGVVSIEINDAERSLTTNGRGQGSVIPFDTDGTRLYAGSAVVKGGEFTIKVAMPGEVADNFRPASMSLYAYATNSAAEAVGVNRDFYVYGFEEPETADTVAPVISSIVLNHDGFKPGDTVHPSPMVIAKVSDNVAINLSTAGIGHGMTLTLDKFETLTDVPNFYTPNTDGTPGGTINYPLSDLDTGEHSVRLRVFDTSGNLAEAEVPFTVAEGLAPVIFDVYTDANPAATAANFYIRHDRPDLVTTVAVTVYDLLGRPVWTGSRRGISDLDVSTPVTWDLTDSAGRRVQRGIYLYRAAISADGDTYETASRRIAVAAP